MSIISKVIIPKSKYDKTIPYCYMAKVFVIEGEEDLCLYYYGDTICSLIEYLNNNNFNQMKLNYMVCIKKKKLKLT